MGPWAKYLNSHFLAVGDVDAQVDVAEAPATDFPDQAILPADDELRPRGRRHWSHCVDFLVFFSVREKWKISGLLLISKEENE